MDEGVPQRSVLSVLLIVVGLDDVIANMPAAIKCCLSLYIDDLVRYISGAKLP